MRKHDVRKWLHAILDLLPVMLIPVFMIYSHRHTLTERTEVDIQYKYQSNVVNSPSDLVNGNIYYYPVFEVYDVGGELDFYFSVLSYTHLYLNYDATSIEELVYDAYNSSTSNYLNFSYYNNGQTSYCDLYFTNFDTYSDISFSLDVNDSLIFTNLVFVWNNDLNTYLQSFDEDFGIGLPQYTDYNVIESVDVQDTNSDIMSVFMDDFNNAIDKYFNMGNVFNLGGVYQWFNTNIFSGHSPTVIYSIWNIALYELCMDLLFLLYGLFMWFIDMVEKIMDKPFKSIK